MSQTVRALIVDDEALARLNIRAALADYPQWQIAAELANGQELFEQLHRTPIDVLFLDIQMPGISGLELARKITALPKAPLIIFVTAYDHYAVEAFELFALDYLLKPFDDERFQRCLQRAEQALSHGSHRYYQNLWRHHTSQDEGASTALSQLVIRSVGSIRLVPMADVRWFAASGNYVEVHHREGMHLHRVSLSYLEQQLEPSQFCRVHRGALVKLSEVREFHSLADDQYRVILSDGSPVKVSSSYKSVLLERLGIEMPGS